MLNLCERILFVEVDTTTGSLGLAEAAKEPASASSGVHLDTQCLGAAGMNGFNFNGMAYF